MNTPNWRDSFRDLPIIPKIKQWKAGSQMTQEQIVSFKLLQKQTITPDEEKSFSEIAAFYAELADKLKKLDYASFSTGELEEFKNYIFYAFNYRIFALNGITIFSTYRLVVNEKVLGKNERITDSKFLSYPDIDIVKKINRYNRANTTNSTIFYSCQNIDTGLIEIRPAKNKLVTVGVWIPTGRKEFTGYAISNSDVAAKFNVGLAKSSKAFEETKDLNHELFFNFAKNYLELIGYEFTKRVNHHYEYLISALFSETTLRTNSTGKDQKFDCIIYPSVGNGYKTDNVALLPEIVDKEFRLEKAIEFEIAEQYYDKDYIIAHPETVTLAKIKNLSVSKNVTAKGEIIWD
ncbi:MAG: hypothetical protein ABIQ88_17190 [Chitinophagaceae bacterium]